MPRATKTDATSLRPVRTEIGDVDAGTGEIIDAPDQEQDQEQNQAEAVEDFAPRLFGQDGVRTPVRTPARSDVPPAAPPAALPFMAPLRPAGSLGTREEIEAELDGIAYSARAFALKQPDQVMRECAAYSARLTELAVLLHRSEDYSRQYTRVRTMQVQKWQEELDRQFKIASRLVEVARQDIELTRG